LAELFALLQTFSTEKDEVPKDYLYDLALALWFGGKAAPGLPASMKKRCRYHEHDTTEVSVCVRLVLFSD